MKDQMDDHDNSNLVPSQHEAEEDWALEPVGEPEEFGLAKDSRPSKKRVWNRQEIFLAAFAECGKPGVAATNSGIRLLDPSSLGKARYLRVPGKTEGSTRSILPDQD